MSVILSSANKPSYLKFISYNKCLHTKCCSYGFRDNLLSSEDSTLKYRISLRKVSNVNSTFYKKTIKHSPHIFQSFNDNFMYSSYFYFRPIHTSSALRESKVEDALEAIKDTIKNEQKKNQQIVHAEKVQTDKTSPKITSVGTIDQPIAITTAEDFTFIEPPPKLTPTGTNITADNVKVNLVPHTTIIYKLPQKLPISTRIMNELKHYYHGFRLLFIDIRVAMRLLWAVLNGKTLMRREKKQLVRTTADLFRLVPFLVFILIPFAEFALPIVLKFFPGMLPSTFKEANIEQEKKRKRLKMKLEMAKFLQDTIEETALQRKGAKGESVLEFARFMEQIRTSGDQTSNIDIMKFSKLFEDEITLDNLDTSQLRAMCQLLDITPVGPSSILRFQLEMKLRDLRADDKLIQKEGVDSMAVWELQDACRQRGMRSFGVPEGQLRSQIEQWLDLHLNLKIPPSLLLLSRTLYFHDNISTEDKLKATILALPASLDDEAKVKISEVSGDRIDNKSKLEVIRQEEELIKREKDELKRSDEKEMIKQTAETAADVIADQASIFEQLPSLDKIIGKEEIHTRDLEELEGVLERLVDSKLKMHSEVEELRELKDEFVEYKENLDELKVIGSSVDTVDKEMTCLEETTAARRLTKKVESMISKLDKSVENLSAKPDVPEGVSGEAGRVLGGMSGGKKGEMQLGPTELIDKQATLITVNELLIALKDLKKDEKSTGKLELMSRVLDKDKDGLIDYKEAINLLKIIGDENMRMNPEQVTSIMQTLEKEKGVLESEKLQEQLLLQMKQQPEQQQQQYQQQYGAPEEQEAASSVEKERELQKLEELRKQHMQKQLLKQQDATIYDQLMLQKEKLERQQQLLQQENKNKRKPQ